jgi:hypothetical protein
MLDLGKELLLYDRYGQRIFVAGIQQALQYDPAIRDVVIFCEIDPAESAMGQAADYLVLVGYQLAGLQLWGELEGGAALRAEAFGTSRLPIS